jgi:carboxypeptidase T
LNFYNQIISKHLLATALIACFSLQSISINAKALEPLKPSKISFSTPEQGRKLAISLHHALLEIDYAKGFLIADISADEQQKIRQYGFESIPAKDWLKRYQQYQKTIKQSEQKATGISGFSCYATVEETYQQAELLAQANPNLAEWIDIGDSWQKINQSAGYDLMVLKITNQNISGDKPKLFINTGLHAREYAPAALGLDFAKLLLQDYQSNADIRWLVDQHEIHLLLQTNPDGRKIAESGILQRKNMNANHCSGSTIGVDINRNFAFTWGSTADGSSGNSCSEIFRGSSAESEPETQALSNYVRSIFSDNRGENNQDAAPEDTTGIHLDIHSYSELVLWPNGHTQQPTANDQAFVALGNKFAWFNQYSPQQSIGLYPTDGTSDNVSYGELGVAAFTFELGNSFFEPCRNYESRIKRDNLKALIYAAKAVAAPYKLGFGPEVTNIILNQQITAVTVEPNEPIELLIIARADHTKQPSGNKKVTRVIYSIDVPINDPNATLVELTEHDGDLSSNVEELTGVIQTSGLSEGEHIVYFQAFDGDNAGVISAQFFHIKSDNNQAPQAEFSYQCDDLVCRFDASSSEDADGEITSYQWLVSSSGQTVVEISGLQVSYAFTQSGAVSVQLTVTDNLGAPSQVEKVFSVDSAQEETGSGADTESSSSGGGSMTWLVLLLVMVRRRNLGLSYSD